MNDNFKIGTWLRVYTNALMMDSSTMIGYVTEYGKCDFGLTVTIKNSHGGIQVPLAYIVGPVNVQNVEANLPVVQRAHLNVANLVPCIVPLLEMPVVAVIRPDKEWWQVREGQEMWRTRKIAIQGRPVPWKRAIGLFPEFKKSFLIYKEE